MEIESIKFEYTASILTVTYADGTQKEYTFADADMYLQDHPTRESDLEAMGWA